MFEGRFFNKLVTIFDFKFMWLNMLRLNAEVRLFLNLRRLRLGAGGCNCLFVVSYLFTPKLCEAFTIQATIQSSVAVKVAKIRRGISMSVNVKEKHQLFYKLSRKVATVPCSAGSTSCTSNVHLDDSCNDIVLF